MSDTWIIRDTDRGNEREAESRSDAEETKNDLVSLGADPTHIKIVPPGETDGGTEAVDAEVVDHTDEKEDADAEDETAVEPTPVDTDKLPDDGPSVSEDPLTWMPSEFTKTVDGTVTITRKGYEVLAHHYDIQGGTDMVISPIETDMDYAVHKATVTDADGDEYTAYGEAHAEDNGVENIVRMSDTRAYKRAVSRATGVGTVAIEELQGDL